MRKLRIDDNGELFIDEVQILRKDITGVLLYEICKDSLNNNMEFDINKTDPFSSLFERIMIETKEDTEFSRQFRKNSEDINELESEKNSTIETLK